MKFYEEQDIYIVQRFLRKLPIDNKVRNDNFTGEKLPFNRVIKVNITRVGLTNKLYLLCDALK